MKMPASNRPAPFLFVLNMAVVVAVTSVGVIQASQTPCLPTAPICEYWLQLENRLTMVKGREAVYPQGGQLYKWDDDTASTPIDPTDVITLDGWERSRLVIAVNRSVPAPVIEVWEGQTLVVHVTNLMTSTSASIHWHGQHQRGTPWMDGAAFITQCPIDPLQSFTYKFKAFPAGTFWYHAHIGYQMSMGVVGPLIVRTSRDVPQLEHILVLQDWNHDYDADTIRLKIFGNYEKRQQIIKTKSIEGTIFDLFDFQSGLINGRGRYYSNGTHNGAPLSSFTVAQNETYRFRMIGAGSLYPFRVSIDDHPLTVVASDGFEVEPFTVDAIIINSGERYDFLIHATNSPGRYWIRAVTLEVNVENHVAEAVLEYQGVPNPGQEPTSSGKQCSQSDRCTVLNCPFLFYPEAYYSNCIPLSNLRSEQQHQVPGAGPLDEVRDIFMNFAFAGGPPTVNGRLFVHPPVSALTQPKEIDKPCEPELCGEDKFCSCPYSISLEHNKVYQIIMTNIGSGRGSAHPVHMHGHSFHVVKLGFPSYNNITGQVGSDNTDIDCGGNTTDFCNQASWANSSWSGNSVPGLELGLPVRKDTIMIPSGGYVVVRILADNPGVWLVHCHMALHNTDGMAVMLNESFTHHPNPPYGFQTCGDFHYGEEPTPNTDKYPDEVRDDDDDIKKRTFWIVVGCLLGLVLVQFITIIYLWRRAGRQKSPEKERDPKPYSNDGFNPN